MNSEGGFFLNSGVLHLEARRAYARIKFATSEIEPGQDDALTAVLFSAATLEAFIEELALQANSATLSYSISSAIASLAAVLEEIESSHGSVKLKYLVAKSILSGKPYDKGRQPYQDFNLLFSIRDALVHPKPERITKDPHKLVRAIASRGLCEPEDGETKRSWMQRISTRATARWACNVVGDMVGSLSENLRQDAEASGHPFTLIAFRSNSFERIG